MKRTNLCIGIFAALALAGCGGGGSEAAPEQTQVVAPVTPPVTTTPEPELETVWTFAIHEDPVAILNGPSYASFVSDFYAQDFNNDGITDIILGGPTWSGKDWSNKSVTFDVLRGTEDGFVEDQVMLFENGSDIGMIHLVDILAKDFDGNGTTDLVFSGTGLDTLESSGDRVYYYSNTGNGLVNTSDKVGFDKTAFFHSATVGDFNGDGFEDLSFWQSQFGDKIELKESVAVTVKNTGAGEFVRDKVFVPAEFAPEYITDVQGGSWGVSNAEAFDLNNSGCDDVVVGGYGMHHPSMILFNHCDGQLSEPAVYANNPPAGTFVLPVVDGYERVIDTVEFPVNDDDLVDIAVIRTGDKNGNDYTGNYIQFLRNNGDETFTDVTDSTIKQSNGPKWFIKTHVHDFDKDGYLDIAFTVDNGFEDATITDVLWRGTATGLEQVDIDFKHINGSLVVADVNSDGNVDLLVRRVFEFGTDKQRIEYKLLENIAE